MRAEAGDQALVEAALRGDREAFGGIVEKYQGLVCAIAYSATRDFSLSEDLAQETFLHAWRQLATLRDASRLGAWLCAMARNLAATACRKRQRDPIHGAESLEGMEASGASAARGMAPRERAISKEEERLVSTALEVLPENYREPLVLYYRQERSVREVAQALEISEKAARQRLARARQMLRAEVARTVESALERSRPTGRFASAVLAALPALGAPAEAGSAAGTLAAAKGAAAAGAAKGGAAGGLGAALGGVLGPLVGVLGAWFGARASLEATASHAERRFVKKCIWIAAGLVAIFGLLTALIVHATTGVAPAPGLSARAAAEALARARRVQALALAGLGVLYAVALGVFVLVMNRRQARIRARTQPDLVPRYPGRWRRRMNTPTVAVYGSMAGAVFGSTAWLVILEIAAKNYLSALGVAGVSVAIYLAAVRAILRAPRQFYAVAAWTALAMAVEMLVFLHLGWGPQFEKAFARQGGSLLQVDLLIVGMCGGLALLFWYKNRKGMPEGFNLWVHWEQKGARGVTPESELEVIRAFTPGVDEPIEAGTGEGAGAGARESAKTGAGAGAGAGCVVEVLPGEDAWRFECRDSKGRRLRLFAVEMPGNTGAATEAPMTLLYQAQLKCRNLKGHAWLQMWVRLGGVDFFSRGHTFHVPVSGTQEWTADEIPFFVQKGQKVELMQLDVVVDGTGEVQVRRVRLTKAKTTT